MRRSSASDYETKPWVCRRCRATAYTKPHLHAYVCHLYRRDNSMKNMHWTELAWIGFDTESTGLDTATARIIQAAVITHDPSGELVEKDYVIYIDPGEPISASAAAIHGITAETLKEKNAMDPATGIPYLMGYIQGRSTIRGFPLVIYNAGYDWPLLMAECARIPIFDPSRTEWLKPYILDPLVIDRALDKYRKGSRKLVDVAAHYGVVMDGTAHDAAVDARASLGVMQALIEAFPELKTRNLEEMRSLQSGWYREWSNHINSYWQENGKADRVTGSWPGGKE
jgi:DNA polymerase III subunit epsilon